MAAAAVLLKMLAMGKQLLYLKFTWFLAFLVPLSLFSCEKDELTKPVEVQFKFKLDKVPQEGRMSFHAGTMDLKSIAFTGDRATGEDISFTSDFGTIVRADLGTGNSDPVIKFDIPQGTYNQISLLVDPDDVEPDITLTGKYLQNPLGISIPVQLEIDIADQLSFITRSADGNTNIILNKDTRGTIEIFLNPSVWFRDVPVTTLDGADLEVIRGVPSILISKNFNQELYLKLSNLIEVSAEAVFK